MKKRSALILLGVLVVLAMSSFGAYALAVGDSIPPEAPQVHYAFDLNYSPGGGIVSQGYQSAGSTVASYAATRPGSYSLAGWYLTPALTGSAVTFPYTLGAEDVTFYAKWTPAAVLVTWEEVGGTYVPNFNGVYDGLVTQPANPSKAGYTFAGWYKEPGYTNAWNFASDKLTADCSLYAKWTGTGPGVGQVLVNYDWNNGNGTYDQVATTVGAKLTAPTAPARTGYTFGGWYEIVGTPPTDEWLFATETVAGADTLYAKWTPINYTVAYEENGGLTVADATPLNYSGSTPPVVPGGLPTTTKLGFTLAGWYKDAALTQLAGIPGAAYSVTMNQTLYAKWLSGHVVTLHDNYRTPSDVIDFTSAVDGGTVTQPVLAALQLERTGYNDQAVPTKFYTTPQCTTEFIFGAAGTKVYGATDLYLKWVSEGDYKVTFDSKGGSYVAPVYVSPLGSKLLVKPADPVRTGYVFGGWYRVNGNPPTTAWVYAADEVLGDTTLYAKWNLTGQYVITFAFPDTGLVHSAIAYTAGSSYVVPSDPTKAGCTFARWNSAANGSGTDLTYAGDHLNSIAPFTPVVVSSNLTWYAQFTDNTYTVTFSTPRGIAPASQTKGYNALVDEPTPALSVEYYEQTGWFTGSNGTGTKWDFATMKVQGNMTLYANWTPVYVVTLNTGDSTSTLTFTDATVATDDGAWWMADGAHVRYGYKLNAPVYSTGTGNPTLAGYDFVGWFKDSLSGPQWVFGAAGNTVDANMTLYAKFVRRQWTQTFYPMNGSDPVVKMVDRDDTPPTTVIIEDPAAPAGFNFLGWHQGLGGASGVDYDNVAGSTVTISDVDGDTNYKAIYQKTDANGHVLTYRKGYGDEPMQNVLSVSSVLNGAVITPPAISRPGYTFNGWFYDTTLNGVYDDAGNAVTSITVAGDPADGYDLVAKWTAVPYTVTYDAQGGTAVGSDSPKYYGNTLTAPAAPTKLNYTFGGWYKDAACTDDWVFTDGLTQDKVFGNTTLYAKWLNKFVVEFVNNGALIKQVPVTDGQKILTKGAGADQAPVDPAPAGYTFNGWYTAPVGGTLFMMGTPSDVAVTASFPVYARFTVNAATERKVTFDSTGGSYVAPKYVPNGQAVSAPVNPVRVGYTFDRWELVPGTAYSWNAPVNGDITLTAAWKADVNVSVFNLDDAQVGVTYQTSWSSLVGVPAAPAASASYGFNGKWYTSAARNTEFNFATPVTADVTLYAGRTGAKQAVTFVDNSASSVDPASQSVLPGDKVVEPTNVTRAGYILEGWYITSATGVIGAKWDFNVNVVSTAPLTLSANWVWACTVNYNWGYAAPGGQTQAVKTMYNRTTTAPTAAARSGWELEGWYTTPTFSNQWSFSFDKVMSNMTLYAKWNDVGDHTAPWMVVRTNSNAPVANWGTTYASSITVKAYDNSGGIWWRAAWRNGVKISWPWGSVWAKGTYVFMAADYSGNTKYFKMWKK